MLLNLLSHVYFPLCDSQQWRKCFMSTMSKVIPQRRLAAKWDSTFFMSCYMKLLTWWIGRCTDRWHSQYISGARTSGIGLIRGARDALTSISGRVISRRDTRISGICGWRYWKHGAARINRYNCIICHGRTDGAWIRKIRGCFSIGSVSARVADRTCYGGALIRRIRDCFSSGSVSARFASRTCWGSAWSRRVDWRSRHRWRLNWWVCSYTNRWVGTCQVNTCCRVVWACSHSRLDWDCAGWYNLCGSCIACRSRILAIYHCYNTQCANKVCMKQSRSTFHSSFYGCFFFEWELALLISVVQGNLGKQNINCRSFFMCMRRRGS